MGCATYYVPVYVLDFGYSGPSFIDLSASTLAWSFDSEAAAEWRAIRQARRARGTRRCPAREARS